MRERMMRFCKFLTSRAFGALVLVVVQFAIIIVGLILLSSRFLAIYGICVALSLIVVIYLMSKRDNPSYKLAWIIPILLFPVFGGLFYLMFGNRKAPKRLKANIQTLDEQIEQTLPDDSEILEDLREESPYAHRQAVYLRRNAMAPTYRDTSVDFQTPGEAHFPQLLEELEKAERYIFMEYFIVNPGVMFDTILDLLARKAAQGVDVRFIYDDFGSLMTAPNDFVNRLEARGIHAECFNRVHGYLRAFMNFRNHRKVTIIDGKVAFTGGVNLADEYINARKRFGYWLDSALKVEGPAVWTLTTLFLETWNSMRNITDEDIEIYRAEPQAFHAVEGSGYVTPFGDSPFDDETVGENVYRSMIAQAQHYVYITTPYFIVDNEMMSAIEIAARSGVDVRIIVPHIPDKKLVFLLTQSHYPQLLAAGVKIYEFTPGFIHTKACIIDDTCASVGTVNFDYRSFYLHFECGVWMYRAKVIDVVRDDFLETLTLSQEITDEDVAAWSTPKRILQAIARFLAPLL